jgi:putative ABC transport system permease protein
MFRVAVKDLMARKRRLVTTGVAIVLGIAFLTGTQLLSSSLSDSIDDLIGDVYDGIDAVVRSPDSQDTPLGQPIRAAVPASLVDEVAAVDGVRTAEGFVESTGPQLIGRDGKVYGASGFGPPTLVYNWIEDDQLRTGQVTEGRGPEADDEVALDFDTVDGLGVELGDPVTVSNLQEGTEEFTLVGVLGLGEDGTKSSGARPMFFTTDTAMRLVDQDGEFNFVAAAADEGVSQDELVERIAFALPGEQVLSGEAYTEESAESISQFVDILNIFVSVFGYIALFVAVFIIYNTFSIVVAQRTRETALLRAIGARRRQVLAATMLEAVVVGVIAAVLGLLVGTLLAAGLIQLVGSVFTVASGVPPLTVSAVLTAMIVGIVVTVLSAYIPALRSSKVPPIAALTETAIDRSDLSLSRKIWGTVLVLAGIALIVLGLSDPDWLGELNPLVLVGVGAVAVLLSVAIILGPLIAAPVSRVLARLFSLRGGLPTRLAGENAARNPKRTAATAAALTIGVTLVVVIAIVASSIKATADNTIASSVSADFVVATASVTSLGAIPATLQDQVAELPDVAAASPIRFGPVTLLDDAALEKQEGTTTTLPEGMAGITAGGPAGETTFVLGIDPDSWFDIIDNGELEGSPADLTDGTLAVNRKYADDRGWELGDRIPVYFAQTGEQELEVALIFDRNTGQGEVFLPMSTYAANQLPLFNSDAYIYVEATEGADLDRLGEELDALVADNPTVVIQDLEEFTAAQTGPIDTFLAIVYGLLGLAIIIALIGIANTLSLSVLERTRELGLLRAVGMSRRQLRRMVRTEAAIIAVFGTLIGLVIGIAFSIALTVAISSQFPDLFQFNLPVLQLAVITVSAALAGIVAAWLPARRAAKLDVLDAVSAV